MDCPFVYTKRYSYIIHRCIMQELKILHKTEAANEITLSNQRNPVKPDRIRDNVDKNSNMIHPPVQLILP